jgi:hypothetical protein
MLVRCERQGRWHVLVAKRRAHTASVQMVMVYGGPHLRLATTDALDHCVAYHHVSTVVQAQAFQQFVNRRCLGGAGFRQRSLQLQRAGAAEGPEAGEGSV